MASTHHMALALALGILTAACSGGGSDGTGGGGDPLDTPLSGSHGLDSIALKYGFVRNVENDSTFLGHDISQNDYMLGAVLSDAPIGCGSNMDQIIESHQHGIYLGFLFGDSLNGEYSSSEMYLKFRSATRSRGLSTSGSTVFCTLKAPADGNYPASVNAVYDNGDPEDKVDFVGDVSLRDCDAP